MKKNYIIVGAMGSGKDRVAEYLLKEKGYQLAKLASTIRKDVDELVDRFQLNGLKRGYYQDYSESMMRVFGKDIWNRSLLLSMESEAGPFVISDGRRPHEVEFWTARGFIPVGVDAVESIRKERLQHRDGETQEERFYHESEVSAVQIVGAIRKGTIPGIYIDNNGTEKELEETLRKLL